MLMNIDSTTAEIIEEIYGFVPEVLADGIASLVDDGDANQSSQLWSQSDVVLITYADQVRAEGRSPLQAQIDFLLDHSLDEVIQCVHLLPFCPYTSDDGFSVVDYLAVDPKSGTWDDIANLGDSFDLMFDLVLNHASQKHEWFQRYLDGDPEYADFFIDQDPSADLTAVVRPRSLPLLTEFRVRRWRQAHLDDFQCRSGRFELCQSPCDVGDARDSRSVCSSRSADHSS